MSRGKSLHYLPIWSTFAVVVLAQVGNSRRLGRDFDIGLSSRSLRFSSPLGMRSFGRDDNP